MQVDQLHEHANTVTLWQEYTCMSEFTINEMKKEKRWCCWLIDHRHQTLDLHICHVERVTQWYACINTFLFGFSVLLGFLTLSLPKSLRCWRNAFQKEYCTWANPNRNIHFLEPIFSWACVNCQNSDCPMTSLWQIGSTSPWPQGQGEG